MPPAGHLDSKLLSMNILFQMLSLAFHAKPFVVSVNRLNKRQRCFYLVVGYRKIFNTMFTIFPELPIVRPNVTVWVFVFLFYLHILSHEALTCLICYQLKYIFL